MVAVRNTARLMPCSLRFRWLKAFFIDSVPLARVVSSRAVIAPIGCSAWLPFWHSNVVAICRFCFITTHYFLSCVRLFCVRIRLLQTASTVAASIYVIAIHNCYLNIGDRRATDTIIKVRKILPIIPTSFTSVTNEMCISNSDNMFDKSPNVTYSKSSQRLCRCSDNIVQL